LKIAATSAKINVEINKSRYEEISITKSLRINEAIRAQQLRVIGPDGTQIGILTREQALLEAERYELDLVEISPTAAPPVARIVDWGKFSYQKMKEQQRNRKHTKVSEIKQMRLGLKIGAHDLDIKCRKIRGFLEEGHKVKITILFRGREMAHQELGYTLLDQITQLLGEGAIIDQKPQLAGKTLGILVRSNTNAKIKDPSRNRETDNDNEER
jgi:translation initiation factor IF-3